MRTFIKSPQGYQCLYEETLLMHTHTLSLSSCREINELRCVCRQTELKRERDENRAEEAWKGEHFDTFEWRNYPLKSSEEPQDFPHRHTQGTYLTPGFRRLFQSLFQNQHVN